jgi:hypothetical protein
LTDIRIAPTTMTTQPANITTAFRSSHARPLNPDITRRRDRRSKINTSMPLRAGREQMNRPSSIPKIPYTES